MKRKKQLCFLILASEFLVLDLLHTWSGLCECVSFIRYACMYFMLALIFGRMKVETNLIWDEIRKVILSNTSFFLATNLMNPLHMWSFAYMFQNLWVSVVMSVVAVVVNREFRILLRKDCVQKVLVVGTGDHAQRLDQTYQENRFALSEVVGFVNLNGSKVLGEYEQKVCSLSKELIAFDELHSFLDANEIDEVILAIPSATQEQMRIVYNMFRNRVDVIKKTPRQTGFITYQTKTEDFDGQVLVSASQGSLKHEHFVLFMKRVVDIIGGLVGMVLLLFTNVYVKLAYLKEGDHGPIIYTQNRIGKDGKEFKLYKYRSMVMNADEVLEKMMEEDPVVKEEYLTNKKLMNDPRITKVGNKLRSSSLDELPQLLNVFKGDMSLIGPRPYLPRERQDMNDMYDVIVQCKPGITGMWQTHGRSDTTFQHRLYFDDYYINNWSMWLDIQIWIKTFRTVAGKDGAR